MENTNGHDVYTPQEVAERTRLSVRTVYRLIKKGEIKASALGDQFRIPKSELERLLNAEG